MLNASETAVVLIEFQNEWLSGQGSLHFIIKEQLKRKRIVSNTERLLHQARKLGAKVIHVPLSFSKYYSECGQTQHGVLKIIVENKRFQAGTDGVAIPTELMNEEDIVVEGRKGISGFTGSNLEHVLRANGIKTVVVAGFATEVCVESTVREAFDKGFQVILASDCSAAHTDVEQQYVEELVAKYFGLSMEHSDIISALA